MNTTGQLIKSLGDQEWVLSCRAMFSNGNDTNLELTFRKSDQGNERLCKYTLNLTKGCIALQTVDEFVFTFNNSSPSEFILKQSEDTLHIKNQKDQFQLVPSDLQIRDGIGDVSQTLLRARTCLTEAYLDLPVKKDMDPIRKILEALLGEQTMSEIRDYQESKHI